MRKNIGLVLMAAIMAIGLTGCGKLKLAEYKGLEGQKVVFEITDEDVSGAVDEMLYDYVQYDPVTDRGAKNGDYVNITYKVTVDGEYDEDLSGEEEDICVGDEYLYPEVEKAIVGMKTGESTTVTSKLTEEYAEEDLVGKEATIELTVNEISVEILPEYNDDFVKENLGFDSVAAYEEDLKQQLYAEKEDEYKYECFTEILQEVIDNSEFGSYSKELYKKCQEEYDANNENMASMYGMELKDYEEMMGIDDKTKKTDIEGIIHEKQVVEAIAKKEGLEISDKEVKEFAEQSYADYECESADAFIKEYGEDSIKEYLLMDKLCNFVYDNAKLTEVSEEEYLAAYEGGVVEDDNEESEETESEETESDEAE
ncbi:MAG: FKBP-type peptidyl-prolyl cis-trans isomerase [Lachnospiraceae bacterium]|nr:FKBP-type peptidyl-prolyl cis-trans isomerase [Lachnospiraceae bacterium]